MDLDPQLGSYRKNAVSGRSAVRFTIIAERNGTPIPVVEVNAAVDTFTPKAAGLIRIDLMLGEDTDADGLPDAWERYQVNSDGSFQGDPLGALSREGDFDRDGQSDWDEYIAGTFAAFSDDSLVFRILDVSDEGRTSFEFFAVNGKTYTLEVSNDAKRWTREAFEIDGAPLQTGSAYKAAATEMSVMHVTHSLPRSNKQLYRLRVN